MIRAIEAGDSQNPVGGSTAPAIAPGSVNQSGQNQEDGQAQAQENTADDDEAEDEDPKARGSKSQVLKDLARERDRRQAVEKELEERKRAEMTEQERLKADLEKANAVIAELKEAEAARELAALKAKAVTSAGLPAEMADRITGSTLEELTEDAKKLKAALGPDRSLEDPGQGQSQGAGKQTYRTLAEATRAKLGIQ